MIKRLYKRLTSAATRGWLLVGTLLGLGTLPCPECGLPMILHFWPVAGLVLVVQTLKRRYRGTSLAKDEVKEKVNATPVDHRGE